VLVLAVICRPPSFIKQEGCHGFVTCIDTRRPVAVWDVCLGRAGDTEGNSRRWCIGHAVVSIGFPYAAVQLGKPCCLPEHAVLS
jgi:hypothetical protein